MEEYTGTISSKRKVFYSAGHHWRRRIHETLFSWGSYSWPKQHFSVVELWWHPNFPELRHWSVASATSNQWNSTKRKVIIIFFFSVMHLLCLRNKPSILWIVKTQLLFLYRFLKKNMVLWGIWQGKGKPAMHAFQRPLVMALNKLSDKGKRMNN